MTEARKELVEARECLREDLERRWDQVLNWFAPKGDSCIIGEIVAFCKEVRRDLELLYGSDLDSLMRWYRRALTFGESEIKGKPGISKEFARLSREILRLVIVRGTEEVRSIEIDS